MDTPNGTMVFDETGGITCPRCQGSCSIALGIVGHAEGDEVCPACCRLLTGLTHVRTTGPVVNQRTGIRTVRTFTVDLVSARLSGA